MPTNTKPYSVGDTVLNGQYRVDKVIQAGEKNLSRVYKVFDLNLHKYWCLKEVVLGLSEQERNYYLSHGGEKELRNIEDIRTLSVDSLKYEYSIMGMLNIPEIPRALNPQYNDDKSRILYIMDWVDGEMAKSILKSELQHNSRSIPDNTVISWGKSVLEVLGYLHRNNIVYRDLKPENLMISQYNTPTERLHIIDFGTAHLVANSEDIQVRAVGTKGYAPPEQCKNNVPYDTRWDLYALGATLFHLVTGIHPLEAAKQRAKAANARRPIECDYDIEQYGTGFSAGLRNVILKSTAKNPDERYQSASEMLVDMNRIGKYDSSFRSKAKTKIWVARSFIIAGILLGLVATSAYAVGSQNVAGQINNLSSIAESSGSFEDYKKWAEMDGTNIDAYMGMINSLRKDGKVSADKEQEFLGVLLPNVSDLKKDPKYGDLAYNIGSLYFFYYGDVNDVTGQKESGSWFKDAIKYNATNKELASSLYAISDFQGNVQAAMRDGSDAGMYKNVWNALNTALKSVSNDSVIEAATYSSLVDLISNYSYKLAQEGVPLNDVISVIKNAQSYASKTSSNDSTRTEQIKKSILQTINGDALLDEVKISYATKQ